MILISSTLLAMFQREENRLFLSGTNDEAIYRLLVEEIPFWVGTAIIALCLVASLARSRATARLTLKIYFVLHLLAWATLILHIGINSFEAFE